MSHNVESCFSVREVPWHGLGNIRGTGWGFMNAVSDMTTHRPPARKTENYQENMFIYTLDAPVILDAALKLVKARA